MNRDVGKSCPAALTEGTRHRRGKGAGRSTGRTAGRHGARWFPAKGGLVEAIGACPPRTKVKRRKATVTGAKWLAARKPDICRRHGGIGDGTARRLLALPREICWAPRKR